MGKQITFYMDKKTEDSFIDFIQEKGGKFIFCQDFQIYFDKNIKEMRNENGSFLTYIYNENFGKINIIDSINFKNEPFQYVSTLDSPIIEFYNTAVALTDKKINYGRIYVQSFYLDKNGNKIQKSKALDDFYKTLVKWIKKNVPYQKFELNGNQRKEYISDTLFQLIVDGKINRLI